MKKTFARLHSMSDGRKFPDFVDLFYERDGQEQLIDTIHIDTLNDLNASDELQSRVKRGDAVAVKLVEDVD